MERCEQSGQVVDDMTNDGGGWLTLTLRLELTVGVIVGRAVYHPGHDSVLTTRLATRPTLNIPLDRATRASHHLIISLRQPYRRKTSTMARIELIDDSPSPSPTQTRRPRKDGTARKNPVGGSVAASMKRGMQVRTEEPAWRAYVLGTLMFSAVASCLLYRCEGVRWEMVARHAHVLDIDIGID
jgi:hypothetical protein